MHHTEHLHITQLSLQCCYASHRTSTHHSIVFTVLLCITQNIYTSLNCLYSFVMHHTEHLHITQLSLQCCYASHRTSTHHSTVFTVLLCITQNIYTSLNCLYSVVMHHTEHLHITQLSLLCCYASHRTSTHHSIVFTVLLCITQNIYTSLNCLYSVVMHHTEHLHITQLSLQCCYASHRTSTHHSIVFTVLLCITQNIYTSLNCLYSFVMHHTEHLHITQLSLQCCYASHRTSTHHSIVFTVLLCITQNIYTSLNCLYSVVMHHTEHLHITQLSLQCCYASHRTSTHHSIVFTVLLCITQNIYTSLNCLYSVVMHHTEHLHITQLSLHIKKNNNKKNKFPKKIQTSTIWKNIYTSLNCLYSVVMHHIEHLHITQLSLQCCYASHRTSTHHSTVFTVLLCITQNIYTSLNCLYSVVMHHIEHLHITHLSLQCCYASHRTSTHHSIVFTVLLCITQNIYTSLNCLYSVVMHHTEHLHITQLSLLCCYASHRTSTHHSIVFTVLLCITQNIYTSLNCLYSVVMHHTEHHHTSLNCLYCVVMHHSEHLHVTQLSLQCCYASHRTSTHHSIVFPVLLCIT